MAIKRTTHQWLKPVYDSIDAAITTLTTGAASAVASIAALNTSVTALTASDALKTAMTADETLSTATPAVSLTKRTSRFDLATRAGNIAATLANGTTVGQRKSLVNMSASNTHATTVTPATMGEGKTTVTLTAALDAAELEWQAGGWRVVSLTGTAAAA